MPSDFPSEQYVSKRDNWLGYKAIVLPTVEKTIKSLIHGKNILDIGCGNGHFAAKFIEWKAQSVIGIDNSLEMIEKCHETHGNDSKKLTFLHQGIDEFTSEKRFDVATALFVFQFLKNKKLLLKAFENSFNSLLPGGIVVAIVPNGVKEYNPKAEEGKKFGAAAVLPDEELRDNLPMTINFYNDDVISASSTIFFYFRETYEKLLKEAGFSRIEWSDPVIDDQYHEKYGEGFFSSYLSPPKDVIFIAYK